MTPGAAPAERGSIRALFVVLGGLICQMGLGYNYVFGVLAPDVIADFGWTKAEFAGARAPQLWVMALASPVVGFLVVRTGPRAVLVGSTVLLGAAFLVLSRMETLWQLYAVMCVQALSVTGLGDITVGQLVARWFGRRRGLALGAVYTGSNLGGALLVRSVGVIAAPGAWRDVFQAMGGAALLVLLPAALFAVREPRGLEGAVTDSAEADVGEVDLGLAEAARTRSFWILGAALATFFFYFVAVLDHLVLYLTEEGFSSAAARGHLSNAILLGMVSKVGFGWVADRLTPRTATLVDFSLLAASSLLLLLPPDPALVWVFVVVFGFSAAARDVVYPLVLVHCFGVRAMAQIYGVLMLALPAGALGAWYAAAISDGFGDYGRAFATFAVVNVATVVALLFLRDERVAAISRRT